MYHHERGPSPPSDTKQGKFPANRHRLNTQPGCVLAAGLSRLLPAVRLPYRPAHRSPDPPRARPGGREHGRPGAARRLPVAAAPDVPAVLDDVVYGFGRVADRAMTSPLGWRPGDRLTLTAAAGVVIARRDPGGMVAMPSKPYLVIPAALRRRCGLRPGDRVLLAVFRPGTRWPRTHSRWWTCGVPEVCVPCELRRWARASRGAG